jgi:hypothetical protein
MPYFNWRYKVTCTEYLDTCVIVRKAGLFWHHRMVSPCTNQNIRHGSKICKL